MRAAARGDPCGVVRDVVDAVERHPEPFGDELRKARLVALPRGHRPHHQLDPALGQDRDLGALARHPRGDLDIVGDTDPAPFAAPPRLGSPGREAVPVGERQPGRHRRRVVAAVIGEARRVGEGLGGGRDQVAAAQFGRVDAEPVGRQIDQPLDDEDRLGPAGAAIGRGRHGVGDGAAAAEMDGRDRVDVGHQADALLQWPERRRMPAEIAEVRAADGEETPLGVERQLGRDGQIAALPVAEKRVAALAGPFDRPPDEARRPGKQRIFRVEQIARAEIAAHVAADAAHPLGRHAEDLREVGPHLGDAATAAGVERVTARSPRRNRRRSCAAPSARR